MRVGVGLGTGVRLDRGMTKSGVGGGIMVDKDGREPGRAVATTPLVGDGRGSVGSGVDVAQLVGEGADVGTAVRGGGAVGCGVAVRIRVGTVCPNGD